MARKFYTCIIVPDASRHLHKLRVPIQAFYVLAALGTVSFLVAVGLGFQYISMASRMSDYNSLQTQNAQLKVDTRQLMLSTAKLNRQLTELETQTDNIAKALEADPLFRRIAKLSGSGGARGDLPTSVLQSNSLKDSVESMQTRIEDEKRRLTLLGEGTRRIRLTPSIWPLAGHIGSHYGGRLDPFTGDADVHLGVDIVAPRGTPIKAAADGVVLVARRQAEYGNLVIVQHPDGFSTRYGHLSTFKVKEKESVQQGDIIGWVGMTGRTTAPHLHYEVRLNDKTVNPRAYLR